MWPLTPCLIGWQVRFVTVAPPVLIWRGSILLYTPLSWFTWLIPLETGSWHGNVYTVMYPLSIVARKHFFFRSLKRMSQNFQEILTKFSRYYMHSYVFSRLKPSITQKYVTRRENVCTVVVVVRGEANISVQFPVLVNYCIPRLSWTDKTRSYLSISR